MTASNGRRAYREVAAALAAARRSRAYRDSHGTFALFVADRFGLQKQRAYELLQAGWVADTLAELTGTAPHCEYQGPLVRCPLWN